LRRAIPWLFLRLRAIALALRRLSKRSILIRAGIRLELF
jgi:hypothetical protein